jgi:glycerol-3-phosphate dehydrogenase
MKRNLPHLTKITFDVLIIGGGIYGACLAWEATQRNLSVALIEKGDFGSATSANSLKIIHGGLRYLQHADLKRARESITERRAMMRIAPHLIHPLPILVPTFGWGMQSRMLFRLGLAVNDLIGFDRNRYADPQKYIPRGRTISKDESLRLLSGTAQEGLTGGAIFYDAQVYNSERFLLAFLRSAAEAGASLANYVEVTGFLGDMGRVTGAQVTDVLTGDRFDIRAQMVVNATGPWTGRVQGWLNGSRPQRDVRYARAFNLVTRSLFEKYAVGIPGQKQFQDDDAVVNKGNRLFFAVPWRDRCLIGTEYIPYHGDPDLFEISEDEIQDFIDAINQAYPASDLKRGDVSFVQAGLVPIQGYDPQTKSVRLAKHNQIYDHRKEGVQGLLTVLGVKYTTARYVAEKAIDQVFEMLGRGSPSSTSLVTSLYGGQIDRFEEFLQTEIMKRAFDLDEEIIRHLIFNYGSTYLEVLQHLNPEHCPKQEQTAVLEAEVLYGIRTEMAQKLSDIVFRRTELGTTGFPGDAMLRFCAEVMKCELDWSQSRMEEELEEVRASFARMGGC